VTGDGVPLPPGQASVTVRTHFVDGEDATRVAQRAKDRRKRRRHLSVVATKPEAVDHLLNIHAALREERNVRTAVVLGRLIELDEDTYTEWGFQHLSDALEREHIAIGKSNGQSVVRLRDVEEALQRRTGEASNDLP
jgi:S-DNA-T family DNA segregation ATPase FtsK/SpoIIIE